MTMMKKLNKNIEIGEKVESMKVAMQMTNLIKFLPVFDKMGNFSILCSKKGSKTEIFLLEKASILKS